MMTVKELKEILANADDNAMVLFYEYGTDRDGWATETEAKVKKVKVVKLTVEEIEKRKRWGY